MYLKLQPNTLTEVKMLAKYAKHFLIQMAILIVWNIILICHGS